MVRLCKLIALGLALLLCSSLVSAKSLRKVGWVITTADICWQAPCSIWSITVHWEKPTKTPDSYQVSWTETNKWLPLKGENSHRRGNAIVTSTSENPQYTIWGLNVTEGEMLKIRVRARYDGKRNGPWTTIKRQPQSPYVPPSPDADSQ